MKNLDDGANVLQGVTVRAGWALSQQRQKPINMGTKNNHKLRKAFAGKIQKAQYRRHKLQVK